MRLNLKSREEFYDKFQNVLETIKLDEVIILIVDFRAQMGNKYIISEIIRSFMKVRPVTMRNYSFRINNTFYNLKDTNKYTIIFGVGCDHKFSLEK